MTKAKQRSIKTKQQQKKKNRAKARLFLDKIFHRIKLKYKADIEKKNDDNNYIRLPLSAACWSAGA